MLELWKPLLVLKDKNNPVIFDDLGFKYERDKSLRPFIIFYDDKQDCYYYLKARNAEYQDFKTKQTKLKKQFKGEIFVSQSDFGLLSKDSYVDCSQIFKCNRELLESLIDVEDELFKITNELFDFDKSEIKDKIKECIFEIPPYLSIIEVKMDNQGNTYGESLYLCDEKLDYYNEELDFYVEIASNFKLKQFLSNKSNYSSWSNNRFNNGIEFCKMFLNEYFPNEIDNFAKVQELNNSKER